MRKLLGVVVVVGVLALVPAAAFAQGMMPSHEFGVDVGLLLSSPSGNVYSAFSVTTPVDVRVGFVSSGPLMVEPRVTLTFQTVSGSTRINFDPGVNLLHKLGPGSGMHDLMGPYYTVGADVNIISTSGAGTLSRSSAIITVNGGIGTRMPFGSGASRLEGFVAYSLKNTKLQSPSTLHIGARVGISLWH